MNAILDPVPQESAAISFSKSSDGPSFMFGPVAHMSIMHKVVSTTHRSSPLAVTTRPAVPQYMQSLAPSATGTSLSSQPLRANSLPLPTASGTHSISSSPRPTMLVFSVTSASVLSSAPVMSVNSTGGAQSVAPSSITTSLLTITSAPGSISTAPSTAIASSSSSSSFGVEATPVILASTTVSQSPSPSPPTTLSEDNSSSAQGHHAPFYIAIVLGTIVVIGFIAAVIAWVVRLRLHARRRRASTVVPWANPPNDDGLEEGREATYIGQPINRIGSKDISSQDAVPWEPRGDRDVGEPKRSNSYLRNSVHSSQTSDPFANHQSYPVHRNSVAYPLPIYHAHATMDSYPDAEGSLDEHRSVSTLGPLQVANMMPGDTSASSSPSSAVISMGTTPSRSGEEENGTPQNRAGSRPPFLALEGDGLRVPWTSKKEPSFAKRRAAGSGNWERLPMPGATQNASDVVADDDSWTSSLKSNLTDAFNAVAANLPAGPALMRSKKGKDDDDILTPQPRQQHSTRRSLRSNFSGVDFNEQSLSRNDSTVSKPWTLEERDDGTGRVHFHGHGLDGYGCATPQMYNSSLTVDAPTSAGTSIHRMSTQDSHTPLVSQPPQSAFLRPETYQRGSQRSTGQQRQPSMRSILSRASSVYSVASDASGATSTQPASAPRIPAFSRHSTIKIDVLKPVREKKEDGPMEERPGKLVARSSSSGCSFSSYYYGTEGTSATGGEMTEVDEPIRQSLSRRTKPRRVA